MLSSAQSDESDVDKRRISVARSAVCEWLKPAYSRRAQATDVLAGFRFIKEGDIPLDLRLAIVQL